MQAWVAGSTTNLHSAPPAKALVFGFALANLVLALLLFSSIQSLGWTGLQGGVGAIKAAVFTLASLSGPEVALALPLAAGALLLGLVAVLRSLRDRLVLSNLETGSRT